MSAAARQVSLQQDVLSDHEAHAREPRGLLAIFLRKAAQLNDAPCNLAAGFDFAFGRTRVNTRLKLKSGCATSPRSIAFKLEDAQVPLVGYRGVSALAAALCATGRASRASASSGLLMARGNHPEFLTGRAVAPTVRAAHQFHSYRDLHLIITCQ